MQKREYAQFQVEVKGWIGGKLPEDYVDELNLLAQQGWQVDHVIPLQIGAGTTSSVIFLLKRER